MVEEKSQNIPSWRLDHIPMRIWLTARTLYLRHDYRYHAWDQVGYRVFIRLMAIIILGSAGAGIYWLGKTAWRLHAEAYYLQAAHGFLAQGDYRGASWAAHEPLGVN